jgi:hypothetical protein
MSDPRTSPANDLDAWLATLCEPTLEEPLFWAPHGWSEASDWLRVRGTEHLAVLISTACRSDNNVCFASSARGKAQRTANLIGLVGRAHLGWTVVINDSGPESWAGDVHHLEYPHDSYESFSALSAAEIARAWVTVGLLPGGLTYRLRSS